MVSGEIISVQAQHHAGRLNNTESRIMKDRYYWMLSPQIFHSINGTFGQREVDLFASRLSTQLSTFMSWRPHPEAMAQWIGLYQSSMVICSIDSR